MVTAAALCACGGNRSAGPPTTRPSATTAASPGSAFFYQDVTPSGNAVRVGFTSDQRVIDPYGVSVLTWQVLGGQTRIYGDPVFSRLSSGRWAMTAWSGPDDPRGGLALMYHESECPQVTDSAVRVIGASAAESCEPLSALVMAKTSQVFEVDGSNYVLAMNGARVMLVRLNDASGSPIQLASICVRRSRAASLAQLQAGEATVVIDDTLAPGLLLSDAGIARRRDGTWVLFIKGISSSVGCSGGGLCELCARSVYRSTSRDLLTWSALEKIVERASVPEAFTAPDGSVWLYWQSFAAACEAQDLSLAQRAPILGAPETAGGPFGAPVTVSFKGEPFETDTRLHYPTNANPVLLPSALAKASLESCLAH